MVPCCSTGGDGPTPWSREHILLARQVSLVDDQGFLDLVAIDGMNG